VAVADGKHTVCVTFEPEARYGQTNGAHLEIAVPPGEAGADLSRRLLKEVEELVKSTASYKGKVISFEVTQRYSGDTGNLRVHKLRTVRREDVVLPEKTLGLLDRNIRGFIEKRGQLQKLGVPIKKGVLFYGPPGTGKTHTIHYLASQLPDHTTLLITSEQVAYLDHYFQLARFLQPAMIVFEDVDLIARKREEMYGPGRRQRCSQFTGPRRSFRRDAVHWWFAECQIAGSLRNGTGAHGYVEKTPAPMIVVAPKYIRSGTLVRDFDRKSQANCLGDGDKRLEPRFAVHAKGADKDSAIRLRQPWECPRLSRRVVTRTPQSDCHTRVLVKNTKGSPLTQRAFAQR